MGKTLLARGQLWHRLHILSLFLEEAFWRHIGTTQFSCIVYNFVMVAAFLSSLHSSYESYVWCPSGCFESWLCPVAWLPPSFMTTHFKSCDIVTRFCCCLCSCKGPGNPASGMISLWFLPSVFGESKNPHLKGSKILCQHFKYLYS